MSCTCITYFYVLAALAHRLALSRSQAASDPCYILASTYFVLYNIYYSVYIVNTFFYLFIIYYLWALKKPEPAKIPAFVLVLQCALEVVQYFLKAFIFLFIVPLFFDFFKSVNQKTNKAVKLFACHAHIFHVFPFLHRPRW